jgi:hypothetical protein
MLTHLGETVNRTEANQSGQFPEASKSAARQSVDWLNGSITSSKNKKLFEENPHLHEWVEMPSNAKAAKDDLNNLSLIEQALRRVERANAKQGRRELTWAEGARRGTFNTAARNVIKLKQIYYQFMLNQTQVRAWDRRVSFWDMVNSERHVFPTSEVVDPRDITPDDVFFALLRYVDARFADVIGADDEEAARYYARAVGKSLRDLKSFPKSESATRAEKSLNKESASALEVLKNYGETIWEDPVGVAALAAESGGEKAAQIALAAAITYVTKNPQLGLAVGYAGNYATERYTVPAEFLEELGIDLMKNEDVDKVLKYPVLLAKANERGIIRARVLTTVDAISGGLAGGAPFKKPLVEWAFQNVQDFLSGPIGEYSARKAAGQDIDWNKIIGEALPKTISKTKDAAVGSFRIYKERAAAAKAKENEAFLGELSDNAAASDLRKQDPAAFGEFVHKLTKGSPTEYLYIRIDPLRDVVASVGGDPNTVYEKLGIDKADLDAAVQSKGYVRFSTGNYSTHFAGGEYDLSLRTHMSFDPNAKTPAEGREFMTKEAERITEAKKAEETTARADDHDQAVSKAERGQNSQNRQSSGTLPVTAMRTVRIGKTGRTPDDDGRGDTSLQDSSLSNQGQSHVPGPARLPPASLQGVGAGNAATSRAPGDTGTSTPSTTDAASEAQAQVSTNIQKGPRLQSVPEGRGGMSTDQFKRMMQSSTAPAPRLEPPGSPPKTLDQQGPAVPTETPWSARRDRLNRNGR